VGAIVSLMRPRHVQEAEHDEPQPEAVAA
jgi:hypothetical protein